MRRSRLRPLVLAALFVLLLAAPAQAYIPPVTGKIVDHFRPPPTPYSAGNRGIDYEVANGTAVKASEVGTVTFADQVGGDLFIVVTHPDGIRTTYGYLDSIKVKVGEKVATGQMVGFSKQSVHFGARRGDSYIDPETLFKPGAHLVE